MSERKLLVGFGRGNITPDFPVHISGYGDDEIRMSQGVRDEMFITCIAVTDGDATVLLYTSDMLSTADWATNKLREYVTEATGIPGTHIFCGATHSHSSPLLYGNAEPTVKFREIYMNAAVEAAKEALADRASSQMLYTMQEVPGLNFIRHYEMEDGTYCGSNFGNWYQRIIRHARETDPRMILVKFAREEKEDIFMMNWQGHNDNVRQVGYYLLSSSYAGRVRDAFERQTGQKFAFFMGASGDQNCVSRINRENHGLDYIGYAETLAGIAIRMQRQLQPVDGEGIRVSREIFTVDVDHSWDHMLEQANEVYDTWKKIGKKEGDELGKTYGFTSSYQSRDIRIRATMDATTNLELNVFRIGDMAFFTSENEVFSTVGKYVRSCSPYKPVFIITGNSRYLPCEQAYDYRSYEADTGIFAKGTAEKVARKLVEMLRKMKETD